jgi:hypothetical protein
MAEAAASQNACVSRSSMATLLKQPCLERLDMARIDHKAADIEMRKAAECTAHADELDVIAGRLRESARFHLREADELRGRPRTAARRRRSTRSERPDGSKRRSVAAKR